MYKHPDTRNDHETRDHFFFRVFCVCVVCDFRCVVIFLTFLRDTRLKINIMALIRVYRGGLNSHQQILFLAAWGECSKRCDNVTIEYLTKVEAKQQNYSPDDLVKWLLNSDIHIILTHVHQAMERWDCLAVRQSLRKLKRHIGFPSGDELD